MFSQFLAALFWGFRGLVYALEFVAWLVFVPLLFAQESDEGINKPQVYGAGVSHLDTARIRAKPSMHRGAHCRPGAGDWISSYYLVGIVTDALGRRGFKVCSARGILTSHTSSAWPGLWVNRWEGPSVDPILLDT